MSKAALPGGGYVPVTRLDPNKPLLVTFVSEGAGQSHVFDFGRLPLSLELQLCFANGFSRMTGPAGGTRRLATAEKAFYTIIRFATHLSEQPIVPTTIAQLHTTHIDSMKLKMGGNRTNLVSTLRAVFRQTPATPDAFMANLLKPSSTRTAVKPVSSYSREHFRLVMRAARETVFAADRRIRNSHRVVDNYRAGIVLQDLAQHQEAAYRSLLLEIGGLPRQKNGGPTRRGLPKGSKPSSLMRDLHLTVEETGALAFLLVGLTGQNSAQILALPALHHRADSQREDKIPVVLAETSKPRRGPTQSQMTIPLTGVPTWMLDDRRVKESTEVDDRTDLRSSFGAYVAALRLCGNARKHEGSDRLLVSYRPNHAQGFAAVSDSSLYAWYLSTNIIDGNGNRVAPDTQRLRLTFVEQKQKPVGHSAHTFINTYLLRDRGNIDEYQRVVAQVLDQEVARAEKFVMSVLTPDLLELARADPAAAAAEAHTDTDTLRRSLTGALDTVMNSCLDINNSPFTPVGSPCGASFLLCLGCPNARAEPRHIPTQLLVFAEIEARRDDMEAAEWAVRFALPHARLVNLFTQFPAATVEAARGQETPEDVALVARFLGRELDVK
ncbi:hypothetical protein [Cryobacterium sp. MDB2-10]|uniref:hypothetical protein n=1 Tax=Cryobacterium sp. MDB2-10 TaxID=1259177 RepID=UPI00107393D4|nr:hypothetical protein [Cryobacterium sp. MDB2-10]TFC17149.1 hypothetical protein E3O51_11545 [Cryobacterium sp. MDB2-10]